MDLNFCRNELVVKKKVFTTVDIYIYIYRIG